MELDPKKIRALLSGVRMRPILDFPGYFATQGGRIWSDKSSKFLRPAISADGHLRVPLYTGTHESRVRKFVHRLILETFVGSCPNGMECCHNNGDPADNRLQNLRWDTRSNNHKDAFKHGTRSNQGMKNGRAKLNELQVRIIKKLLASGVLIQKEIGGVFGVSRVTISDIKRGRSWMLKE